MVKIKCEVCHQVGYLQQLGNYYRVRHYAGKDKNTGKARFYYHQQTKEYALSQIHSKQTSKPIEQLNNTEHLNLKDSSLISSGRSLVWLGHQPPTPRIEQLDYESYREFLLNKYSKCYAVLQYGYVVNYGYMLEKPNEIEKLPLTIKSNVMKALVNLSKFLGRYESFKNQLKNYGIKWSNGDNSFNAFLNIINNKHSTLGIWFSKAMTVLPENEQLWLKFTLITGLRKQESIWAFNRIIELLNENRLSDYYNEDLQMLEHFKQLDEHGKPIFLRVTKNAFISFVSKELVSEISKSSKVFYTTVRKHLEKNKLRLRIKELRSYNNTFLRKNGLISELVDLLAGRVKRQVFLRHYLKIESLKELSSQVLAVTASLESSLLS